MFSMFNVYIILYFIMIFTSFTMFCELRSRFFNPGGRILWTESLFFSLEFISLLFRQEVYLLTPLTDFFVYLIDDNSSIAKLYQGKLRLWVFSSLHCNILLTMASSLNNCYCQNEGKSVRIRMLFFSRTMLNEIGSLAA